MSTLVPDWQASVQGHRAGSLSLQASVNQIATASAVVFPGDTSGGADAPLAQLAQLLGAAQVRAFGASTSSPNFSAQMRADGATIAFQGFEMVPTLQASTGAVLPGLQAMHATGRLHGLDFGLYGAMNTAPLDTIQESNLPQRILAVMRALVDGWRKFVYPTLDPAARRYADPIHAANVPLIQMVQRILADSDTQELPELDALVSTCPAVALAFNQWIANSLLVGVGSFPQAFFTLLESIGMVYCPALGGEESNGRARSIRLALQDPEDRSSLPTISISPGLQGITTPIAKVMVEKMPLGGMSRTYQDQGKTTYPGQVAATSVAYPSTPRQGRTVFLDPPAFLSPVLQNIAVARVGGTALKPGQARQRVEQLNVLAQKQADALRAYLLAVCRNLFNLLHLRDSTAIVQVPLSLDWEVGTAYRIGFDGAPMFTGMLASVNHQAGRTPTQVSTVLHFQYVQWGNFQISL